MHVAVAGADVDFAVDPQGRAPNLGFRVVNPVRLTGVSVQAMEKPGELCDIEQAVVDSARTNGSAENIFAIELVSGGFIKGAAVMPDQSGFLILGRLGIEVVVDGGQVAGLGDINAPKMADARAKLRVLS